MRSGMFAELAGVTPRTLRHYRSIGLLTEPARSENGYCEYDATDLVQILRIKRLASLGFSLDAIKDMLDEPGRTHGEFVIKSLDELDHELITQIETLEQQRVTIALIKEQQFDVDIPIAFADVSRILKEGGLPRKYLDREHEAMILVDHLLDEKETGKIAQLYHTLADQGTMERYTKYNARIFELAADASAEERAELVKESVELLNPLLDQFDLEDLEADDESTPASNLISQYEMDRLNEAQQDVCEQVIAKLYALAQQKNKLG